MLKYQAMAIGLATGVVIVPCAAKSQQSTPISKSPKLGKYTAKPTVSELVFDHSVVRLLPGEHKNGKWLAGVEIKLAPGWKTYWRVPGDAGVPAEFVWKHSTNLAKAKVFWPAPKRYLDITGKSIGYKKHVVFPVEVSAKNSDQPVNLDLRLYYAICSDICVPAQANLSLKLPINLKVQTSLNMINSFVEKVPSLDETGLIVSNVTAMRVDGKPVLSVAVSGDYAKAETDILVEGYDDGYFDTPKLIETSNGKSTYYLAIDGVKNTDLLKGTKLKLTVLSGEKRLVKHVKLN